MKYRVCKSFEVESGHLLHKHPGRCRYPHGHSRRIDIILACETLDANDMVCDFAAIKHAVGAFIDRFDHSMAVNSADPMLASLRDCRPPETKSNPGTNSSTTSPVPSLTPSLTDRLVIFDNQDPTTEVMAKAIFVYVAERIAAKQPIEAPGGRTYLFPPSVILERVRVSETSRSWAEFGV